MAVTVLRKRKGHPLLGRVVAAFTALALLATSALPAAAAPRSLSLVRDAEAEALIADYARPLLKAAGLGQATITVRIVDDREFNAFVADSRHIYVNTGTVIDCERPNQLIGVLAHEIGHLAANHLAQLRARLSRLKVISVLAILGGAAAGVASGNGQIGAATMMGTLQVGQNSLLAYARDQESVADAMALRYLEATHQSAKGMMETFEELANQQLFASASANPYLQTHPLAQQRLEAIETKARASRYFDVQDSPELQARHDLVRAKFLAFTNSGQQILRAYPASDTSLAADYARAVAAYRFSDPTTAISVVDGLIKRAPADPYFWELKGQILYETGRVKEAVAPLRKAVALAPSSGLILSLLGRALVGTEDAKALGEAISLLEKSTEADPDQPLAYAQLAIAYARRGDIALADLATAQGAFARGDFTAARQYAARAQSRMKTGSAAWLRADDIATYKTGG